MTLALAGLAKVVCALQVAQATVAGTVRDAESSRPVEHALVALTDLDRSVPTDSLGRYTLPDISPGPRRVAVRFIGYAPRTLHALVPREGSLEIDMELEPTPTRLATIEVRPPVAIRGVETWDTSVAADRSLSMAAVWNHPLLSEPDGFKALGGGDVALDPEWPSEMHIRGGASAQTDVCSTAFRSSVPMMRRASSAPGTRTRSPGCTSPPPILDPMSPRHSPAPSPARPAPGPRAPDPGQPQHHAGARHAGRTGRRRRQPVLLSLRSASPYFLSKHEGSYLRTEAGDWLATLETPALGGRLRLLGYENENEISAAAGVEAEIAPVLGRNRFEWRGRSMGAEWRRSLRNVSVRVLAWHATAAARLGLGGPDGRDEARGRAQRPRCHGVARAAVPPRSDTGGAPGRAESRRVRSRGRFGPVGIVGPERTNAGRHALRAARAAARRHHRPPDRSGALDGTGRVLPGTPGPAGVAAVRPPQPQRQRLGTHQFTQSLRNTESVVGNVFPADLFVGAGAPVCRWPGATRQPSLPNTGRPRGCDSGCRRTSAPSPV